MRPTLQFSFPDGYDEQQLMSDLADHYSTKKERFVSESMAIYDTFDWRLFNKSLVLYESGNKLVLRKLFESTIIHSAEITAPPVFIWDWAHLQDKLSPIQ